MGFAIRVFEIGESVGDMYESSTIQWIMAGIDAGFARNRYFVAMYGLSGTAILTVSTYSKYPPNFSCRDCPDAGHI